MLERIFIMGKYQPLKHFLDGAESNSIDTDFAQVEKILGFPLPQSAYRHQAWWSNEQHGSHSHSRSWQDAGWETSRVDLAARKVRFQRSRRGSSASTRVLAAEQPVFPSPELWDRAHRISGIKDRDALIEAALTALIRREAGKQLIAMGGTMPDFTAPPRERPTW
jgi:hypothetical protein